MGLLWGLFCYRTLKLVSSPAIREAFSLPWGEDFPASPWEEVSRSGVAVIVEATVSEASLAKAVRSPFSGSKFDSSGVFWSEGCLSFSLEGEGGILVL
jgi:hypothetical protein